MKIMINQFTRIIKEEAERVLSEGVDADVDFAALSIAQLNKIEKSLGIGSKMKKTN